MGDASALDEKQRIRLTGATGPNPCGGLPRISHDRRLLRLGGMRPKPIVEGASMRRFLLIAIASLVVAAFAAGPAAATPTSNKPGQPNVSCEVFTSAAPHGFGTDGFANAEDHYAAGGANDNPKAVSQYDVACYQLSTPSH